MTGYAVNFNRRHHRSGHLFQNRYKSILCQEDAYLKELVRYIHLNPLRASLAADIAELEKDPFSGHSYLMGKRANDWQSIEEILSLFGDKKAVARRRYREFIIKCIGLGKQPDLVGGGLIRSAGGWSAIQALRNAGIFQKSDERILGDSDFVENVLKTANESMKARYALAAEGIEIKEIIQAVSNLLSIEAEEIIGASKNRSAVKARALICCWAERELGMPMVEVANKLKIALPTVSLSAKKGMKIIKDEGLELVGLLNTNIQRPYPLAVAGGR